VVRGGSPFRAPTLGANSGANLVASLLLGVLFENSGPVRSVFSLSGAVTWAV